MDNKDDDEPKTASELLKELAHDRKYRKRRREQERIHAKRARHLAEAEAPLVQELRAEGVCVDSVWDLVNTNDPYPDAIPVLVRNLKHGHPKVREAVARALTVAELEDRSWSALRAQFLKEPDLNAKWALSNALAVNVTRDRAGAALAIVRDSDHGECRVPLIHGLAKIADRTIRTALRELVDDPDVGAEVNEILKRYGI